MKQFLTLLVFVVCTATASAQMWFDAGIKGSIGPTLLYDQNVFDAGLYKHKITTGNSIGGRLGINMGYHAGFSLEYASATSKQQFQYNSDLFNTFKFRHNDFIGVFRYSGNGAYVEVGGKYSSIKDVEVEQADVVQVADVTNDFEKNFVSGIFGFGSYIAGDDLLSVNLGIRIHWGFSELKNEAGQENRQPFYNVPPPAEDYDPAKKTSLAAAQLQLEVNYAFGRFAKTACSDRWKLILFQ
jgi:hypothetical protein